MSRAVMKEINSESTPTSQVPAGSRGGKARGHAWPLAFHLYITKGHHSLAGPDCPLAPPRKLLENTSAWALASLVKSSSLGRSLGTDTFLNSWGLGLLCPQWLALGQPSRDVWAGNKWAPTVCIPCLQILKTILLQGRCEYPHPTDEETEAQICRGTCTDLHGQ